MPGDDASDEEDEAYEAAVSQAILESRVAADRERRERAVEADGGPTAEELGESSGLPPTTRPAPSSAQPDGRSRGPWILQYRLIQRLDDGSFPDEEEPQLVEVPWPFNGPEDLENTNVVEFLLERGQQAGQGMQLAMIRAIGDLPIRRQLDMYAREVEPDQPQGDGGEEES